MKRERTNTPLQALVLLNDPQFLEAARGLAQRMMREGGEQVTDQIRFGFRLACGRHPYAKELELLETFFSKQHSTYMGNSEQAKALSKIGDFPQDDSLKEPHLAAMILVANTLMNLDSFYLKR